MVHLGDDEFLWAVNSNCGYYCGYYLQRLGRNFRRKVFWLHLLSTCAELLYLALQHLIAALI